MTPAECCNEATCRALRRRGRIPMVFPFMQALLALANQGRAQAMRRLGLPRPMEKR